MQTAFALKQCKEANYANALENIRQSFLPDLNSMEPQDPEALKVKSREARKIFKDFFKDSQPSIKGYDEEIKSTVEREIRDFHKNNDKDQRFLQNQMMLSAEKLYHYYIQNLLLLEEFADLAKKDKKIDQQAFAENKVIEKIRSSEEIKDLAVRNNLTWNDQSTIRQWFKDLIKTDQEYQSYNNKASVDFEDDKNIIQHLIKIVLFGKETIESHWQEQDISWTEDRAIILSLLKKTIKDIDDPEEPLKLQVLSYNWEDDKEFLKKLWNNSLEAADNYTDLIAEKARNWDIERLAITDRIIIEMAIAEMINFPSIPVKVTINEYIEVSKRYSTPKSKQFINGMLDVISKDLIKEGVIKKSGRGLIDNK